ncbi:antibiotic biosynthesis monooxygenase family protein [Kiloniella sp. b19]|uniref:antibiotic biosynthesis monooxygenase family protein n=1 Tax=Kiloniella sp. GXU_MW_B19 TaxID=3141326 RepID=UPI0031DE1D64
MKKMILAIAAMLPLTLNPAHASEDSSGAVTLINAFSVPEGKEQEAIRFWEKAAAFMRTQPGYISTALHKSIAPDAQFELINIARWESIEAFREASHALRTQSGIKPLEGLVANPALYTVIRTDRGD